LSANNSILTGDVDLASFPKVIENSDQLTLIKEKRPAVSIVAS
jgi:hypothetical protein